VNRVAAIVRAILCGMGIASDVPMAAVDPCEADPDLAQRDNQL
jgi:hypothetical protein